MKLIISSDVQEIGIRNPAACLISGVIVSQHNPGLDQMIATLQSRLEGCDAPSSLDSESDGFKKLFAALGYPNQTPAGQRLIDSIKQRGFKRINNLVDAYNLVSANHIAGIGMHDAEKIANDVNVFRSKGTETIVPFSKRGSVTVRKGDLVYGFRDAPIDDPKMLAWLGERDVDSDEFKVNDKTTNILVVVLGNEITTEPHNRAICDEIFTLILKTCPSAKIEFLANVFQDESSF